MLGLGEASDSHKSILSQLTIKVTSREIPEETRDAIKESFESE